jgi:phage recombination protein Bet
MSNVKGFTIPELQAEQVAARDAANGTLLSKILELPRFTKEERSVILQTCCGGASAKEAEQLIAIAEQRGLNPIKGECYFVQRSTFNEETKQYEKRWAVQASIDSFRIKADETGLYDGQDEPEYEHNEAKEVVLARVKIWRKGISRPFVGVARWSEYVQTKKDGTPTRFWKQMPYNQLAKCAEALAFRKAFPARFAKIYTPDEMGQADNPEPAHDPETGEVKPLSEQSVNPGPFTQQARREAQLKALDTLNDLRSWGLEIKKDVASGILTIPQAGMLRDAAAKRKAEIVARQNGEPAKTEPAPAPVADADSPPPDDWQPDGQEGA